jgi:hypothetical protein
MLVRASNTAVLEVILLLSVSCFLLITSAALFVSGFSIASHHHMVSQLGLRVWRVDN